MTKDDQDWRALEDLTSTVFEAAAGRMEFLRRRETALRDTIASLERQKLTRAAETEAAADDPAARAGADVRWHQWIDRRRSQLNLELARTLVQVDAARQSLRQAHGRHQATAELARRRAVDGRAHRDKQAERGW
jgi:hypothetical protein